MYVTPNLIPDDLDLNSTDRCRDALARYQPEEFAYWEFIEVMQAGGGNGYNVRMGALRRMARQGLAVRCVDADAVLNLVPGTSRLTSGGLPIPAAHLIGELERRIWSV